MLPNHEQIGVVVVMEKSVVSGLARLAVRHHWRIIHLPSATRVMKTLGRQPLDLAIIHIAVELDQTEKLIRWLRMTRQETRVIAVASIHSQETEQMVRHAGAHCYLPQADEVSLERAIAEILRQDTSRTRVKQKVHGDQGARHRGSRSAIARRGA